MHALTEKLSIHPQSSHPHNSTSMDPIDEVIAVLTPWNQAKFMIMLQLQKKHGVVRTTLMRRHKGITASRATRIFNTQKLNPQQESELVEYIERLTARRLPPTREMVQNFASSIAKEPVSQSWVTRFINRNRITITPHWAPGMDRVRHQADSADKIEYSFNFWLGK